MICHCDVCNYTFESAVLHSKYEIPRKCPKCGRQKTDSRNPAVRAATEDEIAEYRRSQLAEMEEIYDILNGEADGKENVIRFPGEHRT